MHDYNDINSDKAMWDKHGFYIHLNEDYCKPGQVDYHTHGILYSRGHKDFKIVQAIDPEVAKSIFIEIIERLDNGEYIQAGTEINNVFGYVNLLVLEDQQDNLLQLRITNLPNNYLWKFS